MKARLKLKTPGRLVLVLGGIMMVGGVLAPVNGKAAMFSTDNFKMVGDFRTRLEYDFDSQKASGDERDDRTRARIRARVGLTYDPNEFFQYGVRLRSGSDGSQQSPHITVIDFDDNNTGDAQFNFDKWYLKGKAGGAWAWVGRNGFPFWKQNELFWDDDVTPAGIALGYKTDIGEGGDIALTTGFFSLPAGMQAFAGNLYAGQLKYSAPINEVGVTAAGGLFRFDPNPEDPDNAVFEQSNGTRPYTIWIGNLQAKFNKGSPITIGADYMRNTTDYDGDNKDETDGWDVFVKYGGLKEAGDWLGAVYYARIEQFAVNNSFAQDDWVRWGSAAQTRASDMKGWELRGAYAFAKNINLVIRLYLVEAITSDEDGNRLRVDFNYKF